MRLWSLHPKYLDTKGLLALWREALLAKKVLEGNTKGYKNHPQLNRFKSSPDPVLTINQYLKTIYDESCRRHYCFDKSKILDTKIDSAIPVTSGQIAYEYTHLKNKLVTRSPKNLDMLKESNNPELNPVFFLVAGEVENWEKVL